MSSPLSLSAQILATGKFSGVFSGWGNSRVVVMQCDEAANLKVVADTIENEKLEVNRNNGTVHQQHKVKLGVLLSTAVAGCDLMSSSLYISGICASNCGKVWLD